MTPKPIDAAGQARYFKTTREAKLKLVRNRLFKYSKIRRVSLTALAHYLGHECDDLVRKWAKGTCAPSLEEAGAIATIMRCEVEELWPGQTPAP